MAYDPPPGDGAAGGDSAAGDRPTAAGRRTAVVEGIDGVLAHTRLLWGLAVAAMALDLTSTAVGLALGLQERNPIALAFIESYGLLGAGLVLKGSVLLFALGCWAALPRLVPQTGIRRNVVPLGLAVPSLVAVSINTLSILAVL